MSIIYWLDTYEYIHKYSYPANTKDPHSMVRNHVVSSPTKPGFMGGL
jgi:hypothetical protein